MCQNYSIHSALSLKYIPGSELQLNFPAQLFKACFAHTEAKNSTASLKNSADASAESAHFSNSALVTLKEWSMMILTYK